MAHTPVSSAAPSALPAVLHAELCGFFDTQLPPIVLDRGPWAQAALRCHGAAGLTVGERILLPREAVCGGPDRARLRLADRALIAHEVAHVVQHMVATALPPGAAPLEDVGDADPWEAAATAAGLDFALGRPSGRPGTSRRRSLTAGPPRIQAYDSYEHWLLGDAPQDQLVAMVAGQGTPDARDAALTQACNLLATFINNPASVTPAMIQNSTTWPVRVMFLPGSELYVTYGELNTLADFFSIYQPGNQWSFDTLPQNVVLPILQMVREAGWNKLNEMRTTPAPGGWQRFAGAVFHGDWCPSSLESLVETKSVDLLTTGLGMAGRDHVNGLLARNACHFAPFSWFRWKAFYQQAASYAAQAYQNPAQRQVLTNQAWLSLGYANHFLQDSFAAGHMVNKTLVMQWFVEWAADQLTLPVYNWDAVKTLTAQLQPGLAGLGLYNLSAAGPSNDPQTAEEQLSAPAPAPYANRMTATGIVAAGGLSQYQAYQNYLAFLQSPVCQIVTSQIHDALNGRGVTAQASSGGSFLTYGDDTMLQGTAATGGGTGPGLARQAALLAESAIQEILTTGATETSPAQIMATFPTQVVDDTKTLVTLEQWHDVPNGEVYRLATSGDVFNTWTTWGAGYGTIVFDLSPVSVDEPDLPSFQPVWSSTPVPLGLHASMAAAACDFNDLLWCFYVPTGSTRVAGYTQSDSGVVTVLALPTIDSGYAPAVAAMGGALYLAYVDAGSGNVQVVSTADGVTWSAPTTPPINTPTSAPALTQWGGDGLLIAVTTTGSLIEACVLQAGQWVVESVPGGPTVIAGAPVMASSGSLAILAYRDVNSNLWWSRYQGSWGPPKQIGGNTASFDPAVVWGPSGAQAFLMVYTGTGSNPNYLYAMTTTDAAASAWNGAGKVGSPSLQAGGPPALLTVTTQQSIPVCAFPYQGGLFATSATSTSPGRWSWSNGAMAMGSFADPGTPSVIEFGGLTWLFLPTEDGLASSTFDGTAWSALEILPGTLAGLTVRGGVTVHYSGDSPQLWVSLVALDPGTRTETVQIMVYNGQAWGSPTPITNPGAVTGATALVDYGGELFAFYVSNEALCWSTYSDDTGTWSQNGTVPGVDNPSDISACVLDDALFVAYIDSENQQVMVTGWNGTAWWPKPVQEGNDVGTSVSIAAFDEVVVLMFVGTDSKLRATYNAALTSLGTGWAGDAVFESAGAAPGLSVSLAAGADNAGVLEAIYPWPIGSPYRGLYMRTMTA
jgi:hypothetical protein